MAWNRKKAEVVLQEHAKATFAEMEKKGDALPFPYAFDQIDADQLRMQLGFDFAASLEELPLNQWIGPVASGFGAHLVYITERIEPGKLPFERVKSDLFRDFEFEREQEVNQAIYKELKKRYKVEVDITPSEIITDTFLIELQNQLNTY